MPVRVILLNVCCSLVHPLGRPVDASRLKVNLAMARIAGPGLGFVGVSQGPFLGRQVALLRRQPVRSSDLTFRWLHSADPNYEGAFVLSEMSPP